MAFGFNVKSTDTNRVTGNPYLYIGGTAPTERTISAGSNIVHGNTNRPERLNSDPNAGEIVTFDSYKCFGFEPTF